MYIHSTIIVGKVLFYNGCSSLENRTYKYSGLVFLANYIPPHNFANDYEVNLQFYHGSRTSMQLGEISYKGPSINDVKGFHKLRWQVLNFFFTNTLTFLPYKFWQKGNIFGTTYLPFLWTYFVNAPLSQGGGREGGLP